MTRIDPAAVEELRRRWLDATIAIADDVAVYGTALWLLDRRRWWQRAWDALREAGW